MKTEEPLNFKSIGLQNFILYPIVNIDALSETIQNLTKSIQFTGIIILTYITRVKS